MAADRHTLKRQRLGRELRQTREERGEKINHVAALLNMDGNKLGRMELAKTYVGHHDLHRLCDIYDVTPEQRHAWEQLLVGKRPNHWWRSYGDVMPAAFTEFVALENDAVEEFEYTPMAVCGLLQTQDYAAAMLGKGARALGLEQAEALVAVRMARQQRLFEEPTLVYRPVISEVALSFDLGDPALMRDQLLHIADVAALPNVEFRVLPLAAGRDALQPLPFTVLRFDDPDPDVAFTEDLGGTIPHESEREVRRCNRLFRQICDAALTPEESITLILGRAEGT
ncbi:helix-turn-helix transcriptional regulator [Streptomyces sp. SID3343]|uniref:helix-turn-helix domain-containing protein n=1 Tax=Streptomyces sp. SID3343 TaxID=2690260 RepID=UPI00136EE200|nr:helix-turn-helix transcriptional regulator [Streptomyces sp. SID3343]MYV98362.1 helix-turn-helix domain-containing protein [Streptomyces sp. SID3343]